MRGLTPGPSPGLALVLVGCAATAPDQPAGVAQAGVVGSSIAVLADGRVAVVDPDEGSVSLLDATTLETSARVELPGEPRALLPLADGGLLVAAYRAGELALVDPARGAVVGRWPVCAGPRALSSPPGGAVVHVACESDGSVVAFSLADRSARVLASGLTRPRALVSMSDAVVVAEFVRGGLARVSLDGAITRGALPPAAADYRPALTRMTASATHALAASGARLYAAHLLVNHDGDASVEPVAEDYGSVLDGNPKINPAVTALDPQTVAPSPDEPALYATFDGGPRVFQGPSALALYGDRYLLVAHLNTHDVALLDRTARTPAGRVVASFPVGHGASGIAVDQARAVAYVDNAFDRSVSRLDLALAPGPDAPRRPPALTRVRALPSTYSPAAEAGRKVFFDATDRHLTPSGVVACATCHPDGGDDGLVWFIHTAGASPKRRRTPALWASSTATAPFHWDGAFGTVKSLVESTVRDLMAGDGLLVDGAQVGAYLDEVLRAPPAPGLDGAAVARGRQQYEQAGCARCHGDGTTTDGMRHAVLSPSGSDPSRDLPEADTPVLRGVGQRAPYFHDGRSPDLRDALTRPDAALHAGPALPAGPALDDLLAYLRSL